MTLKQQLSIYLEQGRVMQIATVRDNRPWICTVFYVVDSEYNFYWLSLPMRRHSQDIKANPRAAITLAVKQDLPVIGIYAEGEVSATKDQAEVKKVATAYVEKHNAATTFYDRFTKGINQHWVYKLKPSSITLFDEYNNKDKPVQTFTIVKSKK